MKALIEAFEGELNQVDEVSKEFAKTVMKKIQKQTGVKGKGLYMPVRLHNRKYPWTGAEQYNCNIGKEESFKRFESVKFYIRIDLSSLFIDKNQCCRYIIYLRKNCILSGSKGALMGLSRKEEKYEC